MITYQQTTIKMALHRDIFWVGRQWAVTGAGIQACDQRKNGKFDVDASRLWEDEVLERLRVEPWFNREDFEKALVAARRYYPEPPRKAAPPVVSVSRVVESAPAQLPKPELHEFDMQMESGSAKFMPLWRIRSQS